MWLRYHTCSACDTGRPELRRCVLQMLQASNLSFNVTPPRGSSSFTPSKLMLMNQEQRMNMLSPDKGDRLYHTDIETGK